MQVSITETSSCFIKVSDSVILCIQNFQQLQYCAVLNLNFLTSFVSIKTFIQGKLDTNRESGLKERIRENVTENVYEK